MNVIQRMIFKRNKTETLPTCNQTPPKRERTLTKGRLFKVKSDVKGGTMDYGLDRLSIDNLTYSKGTWDETLN